MLKNKKKNDPCIRVHQQIYWISIISAHFAIRLVCLLCSSLLAFFVLL